MSSLWDEDQKTYEENYWRSRKALNMTKESIERDVEHLKTWLQNHPYLPPLLGVNENQWLENYLLLNKNNMARTKSNLDLYFKMRTTLPEAFIDRSAHCADMYQSFKSVCLATIPKLTKDGHMVCVFHHLHKRVSEFEMIPLGKRMVAMIDIQLRSGIHRTGSVVICDLMNSRIGHLTRYQPLRLLRAFFTIVWTAYPERIAQIHIINPPFILQTALAFFRPFLKEKIRKRIMVHSNLESLYEYVPKTHLPSDYGGDCADLTHLNWRWEKIMLDNEEWLEISSKKHKIPEQKWPDDDE